MLRTKSYKLELMLDQRVRSSFEKQNEEFINEIEHTNGQNGV